MKTLSLKRRIGLCVGLLMLIFICILSGIAYHEFREAMWRSMDITLQSDLQQISTFLLSRDLTDSRTQDEIVAFLNPSADWHKTEYQIWLCNTETNENTFFASNLDEPFSLEGFSPPPTGGFTLLDLEHNNEPYRVIWAVYQNEHEQIPKTFSLNVLIAVKSQNAHHETAEFVRVLVIAGILLVWAGFGLTEQFLRWGLRPVNELAEQMSRISHDNLANIKPEHTSLPAELTPFVTSWQAMLHRLSEAIEEQKRFTADAAHELKTPIALIKSTLQLAQSQKRSAEFYEQSISEALDDIDRLSHLVTQLLDLSRLENIGMAEDQEVFDVQPVIENVINFYKPLAEKKGQTFRQTLCSARILGDPSQINQLMMNLMDNAVKYAPPQTPITVTMTLSESAVSIAVHDEGGSISETDCRLLFNRFYRVQKARDRHSGGTGLGLAIAQKITELHHGRIHVQSSRQAGTVFVVTLPLTPSA